MREENNEDKLDKYNIWIGTIQKKEGENIIIQDTFHIREFLKDPGFIERCVFEGAPHLGKDAYFVRMKREIFKRYRAIVKITS